MRQEELLARSAVAAEHAQAALHAREEELRLLREQHAQEVIWLKSEAWEQAQMQSAEALDRFTPLMAAELREKANLKARWRRKEASLEVQLDDLLEAVKPGNANRDEDRPGSCYDPGERAVRLRRVVERGRGVVCLCCLKQILHREVQPLTVEEASRSRRQALADEKVASLGGALHGYVDCHDPVHGWLWDRLKDPLALKDPLGLQSSAAAAAANERSRASPTRPQSAQRSQSAQVLRAPGGRRPTGANTASGAAGRRIYSPSGAAAGNVAVALREEVRGFRTAWR
eukprot:gnl/TRDRNA2_/TRDRNA2_137828_c0_seq2.p1 gnl/TRDRNA2_/TRDRNA2_137828_c0~~gnl/TRDRNA2_/TRDRNA2_137828_c0_seq2.p1  ORF type:complete len:304 (+),score=64.54 gnl/TRDRNA2_/TRDRNA2_137828_c0_seq2:57-914(+)